MSSSRPRFPPDAVQGKTRELSLTSDAAHRFERGVDPAAAGAALERAVALTIEICGGRAGPVSHAQGELPKRAPVRVRPERVRALLGYFVSDDEMHRILRRLACIPESAGEAILATPPSWRFDLAIEEDFVEEIARVHGYEHVPANAAARERPDARRCTRASATASTLRHAARRARLPGSRELQLRGGGVGSAISPATRMPVRLANPIASHMSVMRTTLLGGLVQTLRSNLNRDESRVRIFEIGRCFEADARRPGRPAGAHRGPRIRLALAGAVGREAGRSVDFFDAKGDVQSPWRGPAGSNSRPDPPRIPSRALRAVRRDGHVIGIVGELHPRLQLKYELPAPPVVFELLARPAHGRRLSPLFRAFRECPWFAVITRLPSGKRCPWASSWPPSGPVFRRSSGPSKCSTNTAERESSPAKKALLYG